MQVDFAEHNTPFINFFIANYLAMPSTSCDIERMFGTCARQFEGRESLDVERLEAEVCIVDFIRSVCSNEQDYEETIVNLADRVWQLRTNKRNDSE